MKKTNRLLAFILCICMMVSIMPPIQIVHAADTVKRYELATDGIEAGATYLIVNTSSTGSGNALRFYYSSSSSRDLRNQAVTVKSEDGNTYIESGFTNEADCTFVFSGTNSGTIKHGNYFVDLENSGYSSAGWAAWQYDDPERGEGVVMAFRRANSSCSKAEFELGGICTDCMYKVEDLDTGDTNTISGMDILEKGFEVYISEKRGSKIIIYRRI